MTNADLHELVPPRPLHDEAGDDSPAAKAHGQSI